MRKILGERASKAAKKQTMEKLSALRFVVREASRKHTTPTKGQFKISPRKKK